MIFWYLVLIWLMLLVAISLLNGITFPRLRGENHNFQPYFSIILPARNEAAVIADSVRRLLSQDYPAYEVILLDDQSEDGTADLALQAAQGDERLRVLHGKELPAGWLGKNWACHQAFLEAKGDFLIFTDADVQWQAGALAAIAACFQKTRADMLTVWPTQITQTWSERLVVPMITFTIMAYLPELAVRFIQWPVFAAANGQCLAFRRSTYQKIGGHESICRNVLDDMSLAWNTKKNGGRLVQALGQNFLATHMYTGWDSVRAGFAKNILAGHGGNILWLLLSAVFHWSLFLLPWLWLSFGWILPGLREGWPLFPLILVALGLFLRLFSAWMTNQRQADAFFLPISVLLISVVAVQAIIWRYTGKAIWKGRTITNHQ